MEPTSASPLSPALLRRATEGDPAACRAIVEAIGPWLFGMCRRLCPDPEDAYQEVWARVFAALPRFDPARAAALRAWVGTIARRHLVDRHRRRQVRGVSEGVEELVDTGPLPDRRAATARSAERLEAALQELAPEQRWLIVQHEVYGVPLGTLAEEQAVAVGTIKSRLHRGRARLAAALRVRGEGQEAS